MHKDGTALSNYPIGIRNMDFTTVCYSEKLRFVDLKRARAKGQLAQFIKEREKTHPHTRKHRFRTVLKSMALNKPKARRGKALKRR